MIKELQKAIEAYKKEFRKLNPKPEGYCKWCSGNIFQMDSYFGRRDECYYCCNAYKRGYEDGMKKR